MADTLLTYKSTLTPQEVDAALKNIAQYQELLVQAKEYSEQAKQYAVSINPSQFAPTNHANSGTKYGIGTATLFGHVKLSDSAGNSGSTSGVAATPKAVQAAVGALPLVESGTVQVGSINSGQDVTVSVTFNTPMPSTNYSISISLYLGSSYWATIRYRCVQKRTTGFDLDIRNDTGDSGVTAPISVDWIAVQH